MDKIDNRFPRPRFVREDWLNLNGEWNFSFDDENRGKKERWYNTSRFNQTITVPYSYETKESGINKQTFHPVVWYGKEVTIPDSQQGKDVLLHFQASDYETTVWVNGQYAGAHQGGNSSFSFPITPYLTDEKTQQLVVRVEDSMSDQQPRGKQRWVDENFGCWYVQTTGIWQTVWLEFVAEQRLEEVKIVPDFDQSSVRFHYKLTEQAVRSKAVVETVISFKGKEVRRISFVPEGKTTKVTVDLTATIHEWQIAHWTPEQPNLYDVSFAVHANGIKMDKARSYFGLRKISIHQGQVLLNNRPIYQKLILDQGYWPDTNLTAPSVEALEADIEAIKEMGFNGVRKHQKIEDERFYYLCDQIGLLVWAEMPSAYSYSTDAVRMFTTEWQEIVNQLSHYPSIVTWVPFNESWGVGAIFTNKQQQAFTESIYYATKAMDDTRPVIVNDGWEHTISDIITLHDYEEFADAFLARYKDKEELLSNKNLHNKEKYPFANGYAYNGQPVLISEYGGIAFTTKDGWGYGNQVKSKEEFLVRYQAITDAIKALPYVTGYCYTQITDVQQEVNGLLDEKRKPKLELNEVKAINDR
ncbi:glycoside hydrolase family 2 protein [Shouchella patagoniensis]|uniref:glycoside hydrolase family 2 protein n=1 Tax=Shouchella patagoniensis TaxID=228576 RepID=UPI00099564A7|nr:sugar-binding domain-containing protein [Shouchella patagoniensis]